MGVDAQLINSFSFFYLVKSSSLWDGAIHFQIFSLLNHSEYTFKVTSRIVFPRWCKIQWTVKMNHMSLEGSGRNEKSSFKMANKKST